jgi:hypothetical protein
MTTRRAFLQKTSLFLASLCFACSKKRSKRTQRKKMTEEKAQVFRAINGSPSQNMDKVLSMLGGVESLFGSDDIVVIKPNLQWFNQGAPNISAMNTLVSRIMERKGGFKGEIVLAENAHLGSEPWKTAGWNTPFVRNSDMPKILNYNDLAKHLKNEYGARFSVCHLLDIENGAKRVYSPADGPGYVLCDGTGGVPLLSVDNGLKGDNRREVIMSYPIMRTDKGTLIDYRFGVWENGAYTEQPVKFVNFEALNHHSAYCGMTSAVKNYLGICDLSGGPDPHDRGKLLGDFYNFHSFPFDKWKKGPVPGMLGAEIGYFLKTVRKPFLNITSAEYCGLIDRTRLPVAHTRVVAASTDPVTLDFHMAKYVLHPNSHIPVHNPEHTKSPLHQYLAVCAIRGDYCFDESQVGIHSFDFSRNDYQSDDELIVLGEKEWGGHFRSLLKYSAFRLNLVR